MRRYVLWLFVALTVGFAPAPLPRPERRQAVSGFEEIGGHWESHGTKLHITPNRFTHSATCWYEMRIDTTIRPCTFDLVGQKETAGNDFVGIYKVEGDKLILCYTSGRANRPTAFNSGYNQVYTRVSR